MKTLLVKSVALLAPFVALSVPTAVHTVSVVIRTEHSLAFCEGVFNQDLEGKLAAFVHDDTEVIVGGDSRGERQMVPAVVTARTGWKAANVATTAGDLITLRNALQRHGVPRAMRALVVSTSLFQVNDGAIDPGYVSTACFLNMTTWERLKVYADRLGSPWSPLDFQLDEGPPAVIKAPRLGEQGFLGVNGTLALPLPKSLLGDHPWYRTLSLHGARWRIFRQALEQLAAYGFPIWLVQPPISPAWRDYTAGTFVDTAEREFSEMLRVEGARYANVRVVDFYSTPDPRFGNARFYDIQHLNRQGAELFTQILAERVLADLRTGSMDSRQRPERGRR